MTLFTYINECIKHNKEADYVIMKNPLYIKIENKGENQEENQGENHIQENTDVNLANGQNMICVHYPFDNLLSLAVYNPMINNINSDINSTKRGKRSKSKTIIKKYLN